MAGHSHWSKIKRAKGANDAKRGKIWSKIARKIIIAAKPTRTITMEMTLAKIGRSMKKCEDI